MAGFAFIKKKAAEAASANAARESENPVPPPQEEATGDDTDFGKDEWGDVGDYDYGGFDDLGRNDTIDDSNYNDSSHFFDDGFSVQSTDEKGGAKELPPASSSSTTFKSTNDGESNANMDSMSSKKPKGLLGGLFKNKNPPSAPHVPVVQAHAKVGIGESTSKEGSKAAPSPANDALADPLFEGGPTMEKEPSEQKQPDQGRDMDSSEPGLETSPSGNGHTECGKASNDGRHCHKVLEPSFTKALVTNDWLAGGGHSLLPEAPGASNQSHNNALVHDNNERIVPGIMTNPASDVDVEASTGKPAQTSTLLSIQAKPAAVKCAPEKSPQPRSNLMVTNMHARPSSNSVGPVF
jgi:hypothetical protein